QRRLEVRRHEGGTTVVICAVVMTHDDCADDYCGATLTAPDFTAAALRMQHTQVVQQGCSLRSTLVPGVPTLFAPADSWPAHGLKLLGELAKFAEQPCVEALPAARSSQQVTCSVAWQPLVQQMLAAQQLGPADVASWVTGMQAPAHLAATMVATSLEGLELTPASARAAATPLQVAASATL
ncbi:hypothetical protein COO60DRAFT_1464153, partial [Scenedesmus sp. NREL 46B-D3]